MDFAGIPLFSVMKAKMGYMSERQGVLAQNVANADTPGYQAMDVKTPDFETMLGSHSSGLAMQVTSGKHITSGAKSSARYDIAKRASTYEVNPTGNNVSIEEEMSKIAENQAEYQKTLNLYRKTVEMFKTAIGKPSNG